MKKKVLIAICALALVVVVAIGGTVAWLTDKTAEVKNTFTYGDINITLEETTGAEYKIIPGNDIAKDPKVTVKSGSEACYLFVKVEEANWPTQKTADNSTRKIDYAVAEGWTALEDHAGVYYREVAAVDSDTSYSVLANDKIIVSEELNKAEVNALKNSGETPTLTFTAYAVQEDSNIGSETAAWEIINPTEE